MDWDKLLSIERLGGNGSELRDHDSRTPYESDIDRIIFSSAFRRLSRKTQVHPFCKSDHVHTRLTHSLEVAQVGRSLGKELFKRIGDKLPNGSSANDLGSIMRAACLAHDLGNPPFGHAGEEALTHWFSGDGKPFLDKFQGPTRRDLNRFEGNAQGFRILTQLENHLFEGGLRLTYATLGAFCKYPWSSRAVVDNKKFGAFISEEEILNEVALKTGLVKKADFKWCRHPLALLVEAADDICYATIDIEDAVEMRVLDPKRAYKLLLSALDESTRKRVEKELLDPKSYRVNFARMRGLVFDSLINATIDAFEANYADIMGGNFDRDLISSLPESNERRRLIIKAKKMGEDDIYTETFKTEVELGCFSTLECLLEAFCTAAVESFHYLQSPSAETAMSWKSVLVLRHLGSHAPNSKNQPPGKTWSKYICLRRVLDYVSGMTDNYACDLAEQIRGMVVHR